MILCKSCACLHQIFMSRFSDFFPFPPEPFHRALKCPLQREVRGGSPVLHKAEHCNVNPTRPLSTPHGALFVEWDLCDKVQ